MAEEEKIGFGPLQVSATVAGAQEPDRAQEALDWAWRSIDALGGTYAPEDEASGYADAHRAALDAACAAVEALGGKPS